jgi:hypothetical protein
MHIKDIVIFYLSEGILQLFHYLNYNRVSNDKKIGVVIDEWEKIWKEAVMDQAKHYSDICLEGLKKTTQKKLSQCSHCLSNVSNWPPPDAGLECCHYTILLGHVK